MELLRRGSELFGSVFLSPLKSLTRCPCFSFISQGLSKITDSPAFSPVELYLGDMIQISAGTLPAVQLGKVSGQVGMLATSPEV